MTRRQFMAKSGGVAAVAAGATHLSGSAAKAVAVEAPRLDGIWPYCTHWRFSNTPVFEHWLLFAWFRQGMPLKTFKAFVENGGEVASLDLPILDLHSYWLRTTFGPIDLTARTADVEPGVAFSFKGLGHWPFGPMRSLDMTPQRLVMR